MADKLRTTVYISSNVLDVAKQNGINLSKAAENGIKAAIKKQEWILKQSENYVEE